MASLTLRGRSLEVGWWGQEASIRPVLVLLHEGLGSLSLWRDFPAELARRTECRVMAYSRLGHGRSDAPERPHTVRFMHEEAELLPEILDISGIPEAILVGHSDGGSIAIIAAAEHPGRIRALALEAPHVFVEEISIDSIQRMTRLYDESDLRDRLARHHAHVDVAFRGWSDVWLDPDFRSWNLEAYLPRITCPTLIVQGEQDRYGTLRQVEAIARQVSGPVETLILPN